MHRHSRKCYKSFDCFEYFEYPLSRKELLSKCTRQICVVVLHSRYTSHIRWYILRTALIILQTLHFKYLHNNTINKDVFSVSWPRRYSYVRTSKGHISHNLTCNANKLAMPYSLYEYQRQSMSHRSMLSLLIGHFGDNGASRLDDWNANPCKISVLNET